MYVSDNGTELIGMAVLRFSQEKQIEWYYIAPSKLTQKAFIESFNDKAARRTPQRDAVHLARAGSSRAGGPEGRLTITRGTVLCAISHRRHANSRVPGPRLAGRCASS